MSILRRASPRRGIADFVEQWRQPNPYRWPVLGLSIATTGALLALFIPESQYADPPRPKVDWITTFAPDRTDEEIIASNIENQRRKDELEALREAAAERRRNAYRALGRATGLDVDAMEAQIERDRAAAEAASQARAGE